MFSLAGKFSARRAPPNKLAFPLQRNQLESVTLASPKSQNKPKINRLILFLLFCVSFFNGYIVLKFSFFAILLFYIYFRIRDNTDRYPKTTPLSHPQSRAIYTIKGGVAGIDRHVHRELEHSLERKMMYARAIFSTVACLAVILGSPVSAKSADDWKSRVIYQV